MKKILQNLASKYKKSFALGKVAIGINRHKKHFPLGRVGMGILIFLFTLTTTAQQEGINYKALIKDASGNVLTGLMNVQFTIHQATVAGTIVYQEDKNYTLVNGLLIHAIGTVASPTVGVFANIDWAANTHYLNTTISYSGGSNIDLGTTQFMAVPYAKHANTATVASNVKGLEALDQGNGIGWRLIGQSQANYGNIGLDAVDLSARYYASLGGGAIGDNTIAMGYHTTASGWKSTVMGDSSFASGTVSTAMGNKTKAEAYASTAMGSFNTGGGNPFNWLATDPLFEIGNGINNTRSNALTVLKNGTITAPSLSNALINTAGNKALITKEYLDLNTSTLSINSLTDGKSDNDGTNNGSSVFLGVNAGLNDDQSHNKNVGIGYRALYSNTTGSDNTANGYQALYYNTTGYANTANGYQALFSNTTGKWNTANGYAALNSNTTGDSNTANGYQALFSNTTGNDNTANGYQALISNTTGNYNTANGERALYSNTTGVWNTANGRNALFSNTTGKSNTANGYQALYYNTTGNYNTANGYNALFSNTTGNDNTANGYQALYYNTTGNYNTANGYNALNSNTTGSGNVALGYEAGFYETGSNKLYIANTRIIPLIYGEFDTKKLVVNGQLTASSQGARFTPDITLGKEGASTALDEGVITTDPTALSSDMWLLSNDAVVIQLDQDNNEAGDFEIRNGLNTVIFNVNESGIVTATSYASTSDRRLKKDIENLKYGLKEVLQLQPKTYNWKSHEQTNKSLGLIAQEVQTIIKEVVTTQDNEQKTLGISYSELIPVLINAIKEQNKIITNSKLRIANYENEVSNLKSAVNSQKENFTALQKRIEQLEKRDKLMVRNE